MRGGVRKLEVQLIVVPPPTQRPCRMVIDLSPVWRVERAFLEDHDGGARLREDLGGDAAARAAARDRDVGLELEVAIERRRVVSLPTRQPLANRVADHGSCGGPGYPIAAHEEELPYHAAWMS